MPALGILEQDLAAGEEGIAITFGKVQGVVTTGFTEGATAYVSPTTPGGIVDSRPTADNHLVQNIGIVMRAHPSNGAIKVTGIGRANDIPNDVSSNIASNTSAIENSAQLSDVSVELSSLVSSIHHGDLSGLGDNDHPQYVLSSVPTMTEGGASVTGVGACPHPQPFWYGETVTSATAARSYLWGDSTTSTIETVCDDHFQWDSAGKLYVSSTGVYEVDCMFVVYAASDHEMETSIEVDGVTQNATQKNHFHNYKNEYHIRWVGKISAGSYISARNKDVAVVISSRNLPGSTMIVKRLA
jgi:hypothetical protein